MEAAETKRPEGQNQALNHRHLGRFEDGKSKVEDVETFRPKIALADATLEIHASDVMSKIGRIETVEREDYIW